ncbi:MAG TPA: sulfotransferase [Pseudomonadales bacterium]
MSVAGAQKKSAAFLIKKELRRQWKIVRAGSIARCSRHTCSDPVFIVGCGRSGTTILGHTLAQHAAIAYLNEPRDYWAAAFPQSDIWTLAAPLRAGKLELDAADVNAKGRERIRRCFGYEQHRHGGNVLLEKLPENAFRLPFLHALFPDARYIHVWRHGVEVARSIENKILAGGWYGTGGYKWKALCDSVREHAELADLPLEQLSAFERGLLEWRLSMEVTEPAVARMKPEHHMQVDYANFMEQPHAVIDRLSHFMGLSSDPMTHEFARAKVRRLSAPGSLDGLSARELRIGGRWLASWQGYT